MLEHARFDVYYIVYHDLPWFAGWTIRFLEKLWFLHVNEIKYDFYTCSIANLGDMHGLKNVISDRSNKFIIFKISLGLS